MTSKPQLAATGVTPEVLGPQGAQALGRLTSTLERIFSVRLDSATFRESTRIKKVKEFCVGLLENPEKHAWGPAVSKLPPKKQAAVAGSLFLARKIVPVPPDPCQEEKHRRLMMTPAPPAQPRFLASIRTQIDELFPVGWDRAYRSAVFSYTPSSTSCLEYSRSSGGLQRWLTERGVDWFQDQCLGAGPGSIPFPVKYMIVRTSGKDRGVTIASGAQALLAPLHRLIYNHLSGQPWLLRGEARGRKFSSFRKREDEVFVSGDYESATDNLNVDVAEFILRRILGRCRNVPEGIREFAISSLRAEVRYSAGIVVHQKRGQLMGNFLSFPLLCLQNYLAFRFLLPRPVPVKINGDDIVFRCRRTEFDIWAEGVGACGLTLSRGKTMVHRTLFSLNSAFFVSGKDRVREVPVIRLKPVEGRIPSSGDFLRFCRNWRRMPRVWVGALWLKERAASIKATGRSVVGLGIPADNAQIHWSGLSAREAWYRSTMGHLATPEPPVPVLNRKLSPNVTKEWTKMPKSDLHSGREKSAWLSEFRSACFNHAWSTTGEVNGSAEAEWWESVKSTGSEHLWAQWKASLRRTPRLFRGLGLSCLRLRSVRLPTRNPGYWCPIDRSSDQAPCSKLVFVRAS